MSKQFILAYCTENKNIAQEIEQQLVGAGYTFEHATCSSRVGETLGENLVSSSKKIILLISDNFLKSVGCMKDGLSWYQNLTKSSHVLTVVVDGRINENGIWRSIPTSFERVSNVIKYMNFWQDEYLELRKNKRNASQAADYSEHLRIVRGISSEVGEFLRHVRAVNHFTHQEFQENNFVELFRWAGNIEEHDSFSASKGIDLPKVEELVVEPKVEIVAPTPVVEVQEKSNGTYPEPVFVDNSSIIEAEQIIAEVKNPATEIESPVLETEEVLEESSLMTTDILEVESNEILEQIVEKETVLSNPSEEEVKIQESAQLNKSQDTTLIDTSPEAISAISREEIKFLKERIADSKGISDDNVIEEKEQIDDALADIKGGNYENIECIEDEYEETVVVSGRTETPLLNNPIDEVIEEEINVTEVSDFNALIEEIMEEEAKEEGNLGALTSDIFEEEMEEEQLSGIKATDLISGISTGSEAISELFEEEEEVEVESVKKKAEIAVILGTSKAAIEKENIPEALNKLKDGIQMYPDEVNLRFYYAYVLAKNANKPKAATEELKLVFEQSPKHIDGHYLAGEIAEINKEFWEAKNHYSIVVSEDEAYPNAQYRLGHILSKRFRGQENSAIAYLKAAVKQDKSNTDAIIKIANLFENELDKPEKSAKYYQKVLKQNATNTEALMGMARLSVKGNKKEQGLTFYSKAVEINPNLATVENQSLFAPNFISNSEIKAASSAEVRLKELEAKLADLEDKLAKKEKELSNQTLIYSNGKTSNGHISSKNGKGTNGISQDYSTTTVLEQVGETPEKSNPKKEGKVVFITGATSGIGKATANLFAENGYRVIMTGRRLERLEAQKEQLISDYQADIRILNYDVRQADSVDKAVMSLEKDWRNIDILINNAGLAKGFSAIHEGEMHHWEQMIDTNIKGLLYMTRAVSPHMVERKSGHIINVCSTAGHEVYPNGNVYCATKHAVDALTKSMRIDLHKHNVRVSQVSPGHVEETEFARVRFDGDTEKAKIYEDFRPLKSKDVAEAIYFMATRPPYVNVQDILMMGTQQANSNYVDKSGREE